MKTEDSLSLIVVEILVAAILAYGNESTSFTEKYFTTPLTIKS